MTDPDLLLYFAVLVFCLLLLAVFLDDDGPPTA